jgi:hypothetical protein
VVGLATVLFLVDRSPDGGVPSEVVACGFGPVRISAKPLDRFQGGFRILIRVDNEPGNPTILVPPSRFVFVVDGGGVVLGQDGTFTWATVFPVEVPAGGSYEGSVASRATGCR